jgi:exosortase D (VPLPA-CTERM-specific)
MAASTETALAKDYAGPWLALIWLFVGVTLCVVVARESFSLMLNHWLTRPEYSHGLLIPLIAAYLVWRQGGTIAGGGSGAWTGLAVVAGGLALWLLGELSTIIAIGEYALVVMLYGVVISWKGWRFFRRLWAPMLMLLLAVPLPPFLYNDLSSRLQLLSSALGVAVMRLCGISVYLAGNVIDLGHFQMQVVEACDGLRYLFPLMTLGFIVAYFFRGPLWQRLFVFLSSIPITILMNSLRIAMIGVFADFGNTSLAEGLLHELQGWVIFMLSGAVLLAETWVLVRVFARGAKWRDVLGLDSLGPENLYRPRTSGIVPRSLVGAAMLLGSAIVLSYLLPSRAEAVPQRRWFVDFPLQIGEWGGKQGRIEDMYLDQLKLDDYLMADFSNGKDLINAYVAYYASQRKGESVHSPRACIPGGGWRINEFSQTSVEVDAGGRELPVNRALIQLGDQRQLVYYWFKQRDRELTNEYAVKWYIFVDALMRHRTDGALVRLITPVRPGEDIGLADQRLRTFARMARVEMNGFLPD